MAKTLCVYIRPPGFLNWLFCGWWLSSICKDPIRIIKNANNHVAEGYMVMVVESSSPHHWKFWFLPEGVKKLTPDDLYQMIEENDKQKLL